jgi:hypothetical protein
MADTLDRRCGTCARFVRVVETIEPTGEVKRRGECLLGVWPSPLFETNTCSQWVRRGEFKARPEPRPHRGAPASARTPLAVARGRGGATLTAAAPPSSPSSVTLPEDLLAMDAAEFRRILSDVIRDELGVGEVSLAGRWEGGEIVIKSAREGVADKRVPIESFFHKIVMVRDRLRVLEQKINGHPKLGDDEKVQLQQYVTGCYGSLTTFNVLFADRDDQFVGQKGED